MRSRRGDDGRVYDAPMEPPLRTSAGVVLAGIKTGDSGREAEGGTWVSLSGDGSRLAAGTAPGRALIWDLAELHSELRARGLDP